LSNPSATADYTSVKRMLSTLDDKWIHPDSLALYYFSTWDNISYSRVLKK